MNGPPPIPPGFPPYAYQQYGHQQPGSGLPPRASTSSNATRRDEPAAFGFAAPPAHFQPPPVHYLPPPGYLPPPPHGQQPELYNTTNYPYYYPPPPQQSYPIVQVNPQAAATGTRPKRKRNNLVADANRATRQRVGENVVSGDASVFGIGPAALGAVPPQQHVRPPAMSTPSFRLATQKSTSTSTQTATDVWYFIRPVQSQKEPPDQPPPATLYKERPSEVNGPYLACRFCTGNDYSAWKNNSGSTVAIRTHMQARHWEVYRQFVVQERLKGWESIASHPKADTTTPSSYCGETFTTEGLHDRLVKWLAVSDSSINTVDCPEFRDLMLYIGMGNLTDKDLPHRSKLVELVYSRYGQEHAKIVEDLQHAISRIAFTADMWSNGVLKGYMAVTAHYLVRVDGKLVLRSRLVAFRYVSGSHDGENMAKAMVHIFDELQVIDRISAITLDNAASNGTMMAAIARMLRERNIPFDQHGNRIRCFPHIINIAVKTGLKYLGIPWIFDDPDVEPEEVEETVERYADQVDEVYEGHLKSDLLGKARQLVSACRSSGQRREALSEVIVSGNDTRLWSGAEYDDSQMHVLELLRDVDTRWSSIYLMVQRLLYLYPAVDKFVKDSHSIQLEDLLLSVEQRRILEDIQLYMRVFHLVQEIASAQKTPTLGMILPYFEQILQNLRNLRKRLPGLSHAIDASNAKLMEYTALCRMSPLYSIAMSLNHCTKFSWIESHWDSEDYERARLALRNASLKMLEHRRALREEAEALDHSRPGRRAYEVPSKAALKQMSGQAQYEALSKQLSFGSGDAQPVPAPTTDPESDNTPEVDVSPAEIEAAARQSDIAAVDNELNAWLEEGIEQNRGEYDMLQRWDADKLKRPIMYRVALDVMPVQASAVPCERAFSSSKETDAARRSKMSSTLMEVLQILKGLFREERLDFGSAWVSQSGEDDAASKRTIADIDPHVLRGMLGSNEAAAIHDLVMSSYSV